MGICEVLDVLVRVHSGEAKASIQWVTWREAQDDSAGT
jgi:hypothetical protein